MDMSLNAPTLILHPSLCNLAKQMRLASVKSQEHCQFIGDRFNNASKSRGSIPYPLYMDAIQNADFPCDYIISNM